ncbi:MAG: hypothetical protein JNK64_22000 [Myxococcales bacterium]|nr:hypothetical protein [Myxococcales bacterium]
MGATDREPALVVTPRRARVLPLVLEVALVLAPLAASACGGDDTPAPVDAASDTPVDTPII